MLCVLNLLKDDSKLYILSICVYIRVHKYKYIHSILLFSNAYTKI